MRDFDEIRSALGLRTFLASPAGTLYFDPEAQTADRVLVRHFDATVPPELTRAYADLVEAVADWVQANPGVSRYVRVQRPLEVGRDFVARQHLVYYYSTASYDDLDAPPPPPQLDRMRAAVLESLSAPGADRRGGRPAVVERVVTASLLEPTGRTYFDEVDDLFVVVEPKITSVDVRDWVDAGPSGG